MRENTTEQGRMHDSSATGRAETNTTDTSGATGADFVAQDATDGEPPATRDEWYRRRLLQMFSASALTVGLAGCSTTRSFAFSSVPVVLLRPDEDGFAPTEAESLDTERSMSSGGVTASVQLTSHFARYDSIGDVFGLLSTPAATVLGQPANPIAGESLSELLSGDRGREFLGKLDLGGGESFEWQRGPTAVEEREVTLLGIPVSQEVFAGVTTADEFVLVSAVKHKIDGDVVLGALMRSRDIEPGDRESPLVGENGLATHEDVASMGKQAVVLFGRVAWQKADSEPTPVAEVSAPEGALTVADVPLETHRLAAQFVEEMSGTEAASGWKPTVAALEGTVWPLFRPDIEGVAYYEFLVKPEGYLVIPNGGHDHPYSHWDSQGASMTRRLTETAETTPAKFYRLDALSYVAEDDNGRRIASEGTSLVKLSGVREENLDEPVELSETTATPVVASEDDDDVDDDAEFTVERSGPTESDIEFEAWESWDALKRGYVDSYGVLAEGIRRQAAPEWAALDELRADGERIPPGGTEEVVLLYPDAEIAVTGEDPNIVETERVDRERAPPVVRLTVASAIEGEVPFGLTIRYGNGTVERLAFRVSDQDPAGESPSLGAAPDDGNFYSVEVDSHPAFDGLDGTLASHNGYSYDWAGTHSDQRLYNQFHYNGCLVGCGPVAWGMLFGWADHQAAQGNSYWRRRWGLYRENGGYGRNVVAPRTMDAGVRNMIGQLNFHVDTWCAGDGLAATLPHDMNEAYHYLRGRTGTRLKTSFNAAGYPENRLRNYTKSHIRNRRTPVIIGTGWLAHYPLAYGFASKKKGSRWIQWYHVNQGWGGSNDGWIPSNTWFSGRIFP